MMKDEIKMSELQLLDFEKFAKNTDCHLGRITLNNLKKLKDEVHQVELTTDESFTHDEMRIRSVRVAQHLKKLGIGVGDLIIICGNTHSNICLPIMASFYIGSTIFPLSNTMTIHEIKRLMSLGKPKIIFCDSDIRDTFAIAVKELEFDTEIVVFDGEERLPGVTSFSVFLKPTGNEDDFQVVDFDVDSTIATVSCSSGTTGFPKGVCHSHTSLAMVPLLVNLFEKRPPDYKIGFYMNFSNYYWISAIYTLLNTCISGTPRLISAEPFSEDLLAKGLNKYKPTMLHLSPVALHTVVKSKVFDELDFSSIATFVVGGSLTSERAKEIIKAKLTHGKILNGYAASEVGHISASLDLKNHSVGTVCPWLKWKIVHPDTRKECKPGETGELIVKGPTVFKCYLNNVEATQSSFDEEGYFKTGDLLTYDEQQNLYFVDRLKEVIKYRNYQITPAEVEAQILKLSDVLQVCVVGIKHEEDGERPVAFVQKKVDSDLTESDVMKTVHESLADHKQLTGGVVFMNKLPTSASGKIQRRTLKEMAQQLGGYRNL